MAGDIRFLFGRSDTLLNLTATVDWCFQSPERHAFRILFLSLTLFGFIDAADAQPTRIATPQTLQRFSDESDEQFAARKKKITYGTAENRAYCQNELAIDVGLCKGRSEPSCIYIDLYKAWCVAPTEDPVAALALIPARSTEDFFYNRDGHWLTRAEYCSWMERQRLSRRSMSIFNKNCAGPGRNGS